MPLISEIPSDLDIVKYTGGTAGSIHNAHNKKTLRIFAKGKNEKMDLHAWNGANKPRRKGDLNKMEKRTKTIFTIGESDKYYGFSAKTSHNKESNRAKKKNWSICKLIITNLGKYCESSSLHGLRYVGDTALTIGERIFWLISFLTAIAFAAYFINNIYTKFNTNPVIISFSPTAVSVSEIPFPAITICSVNVVKKEEGERILQSGTDTEKLLLDDYCNTNFTIGKTEEDIEDVGDWDTLKSFVLNVTQSCPEMLRVCQWKQREKNCSQLFNAILTDDGYCCTYNRLPNYIIFRNAHNINDLNETYPADVYDWSPEKGYISNVSIDALPLRSAGIQLYTVQQEKPSRVVLTENESAGAHLGLTVVLDAQLDTYYCQTTNSVGFKVLLSNPIETPKMADFGFFLRPGIEARVIIKPKKIDSTSSLQSIDVNKRQCYFPQERYLQFYRAYTERNCKLECQANKTLTICNCVPYFLPKNRTTRICGKKQDACINRVKSLMEKPLLTPDCDCVPACFEISYEKSDSYNYLSVLVKPRDDIIRNESIEYFVKNMAILHFYYSENSFTKRIKSEIYGFSEFLSNTGGLLGLFLGFSFLSAVEIGYHVIIRTIVTLFKRKRNKRKVKALKIKRDDFAQLYALSTSFPFSIVYKCNCYPACFEMSYEKSASTSHLSKKSVPSQRVMKNESLEYFVQNALIAHFYYDDTSFNERIKSDIYGFSEFLSNTGGLLGLFLGFSFLSAVEIVYHLFCKTLLIWLMKGKRKLTKKQKKQTPNFLPFIN